MADSHDILIENVRRLLQKKEWDQKELARRAGMTAAQMSKYMRRVNNPTLAVVDRIAAALGVSVSELVAPAGLLPSADPHTINDCLREVEEAARRGFEASGVEKAGKAEPPSLAAFADRVSKALLSPDFREAVKQEIQDIETSSGKPERA